MVRSSPDISTASTAASNRDASGGFLGAQRMRAGSVSTCAARPSAAIRTWAAASVCFFLMSALSAVAQAQTTATTPGSAQSGTASSSAAAAPTSAASSTTLRVCADPNNMPQSDKTGAGYE